MYIIKKFGIGLLIGLIMNVGSAFAAPVEKADMEKFFNEHPEVILDFLKNHSEQVLEIVQSGAEKRRSSVLRQQWQNDAKYHKTVALAGRPAAGYEKTPVTLVAFSDFLCAYCRQAAFSISSLMQKYPETIRVVFKQVPKNNLGRTVGSWFIAAYYLDKVKAWNLYGKFFDKQKDLEDDMEKALRDLTKAAGLNPDTVEAEIKARDKEIQAMFDEDAADAKRLGFVGTPYFLVNDLVLRGALPLDNFIEAVETAVKLGKK